MMTEWYWSGSLYAFARVCNLRCKPDVQKETRDICNKISECCNKEFSDIHHWLEWLYEQTPSSYFVSDSFANLQIKIQNNTQCLSAIQAKAVKLDSNMFKIILEQGAQ